MMGELKHSDEYHSFRSSVPLKRIVVDEDDQRTWSLYDAGPRTINCPLVCLPPASGRADVFFKQVLALSSVGYRVLAVEYPPACWTLKQWFDEFEKLLEHLQLDRVHLFGTSLGGFLAQKFAEYTHQRRRVHSLFLCNAFVDTAIFQQANSATTFWMMPALVLKKMVMGNFDKGLVDRDVANSIDFMVESLDSLGQQELASRLTLNCMSSYVEPQKLSEVSVTIMDVNDECAISQSVKEEIYKCYPDSRRAHLKSGGNFPYLSRAEEVNVYIQVHLMQFWGTRYSAMEPSRELIADSGEGFEEEAPSSSLSMRPHEDSSSSSTCRSRDPLDGDGEGETNGGVVLLQKS